MSVSLPHKLRHVREIKQNSKQRFLRQIRLEQLERRELMAGDVLPFHNTIYPKDVDGDFRITPLDALVVINELNSSGPRSLANQPAPENFNRNIDVDGDNVLSPLDVLSVINTLNAGEGELPPVVGVKYQFFRVNADGSLGTEYPDANPSTPTPDVIIGTGDRLIVRTAMTDLRRPQTHQGAIPRGVFSAYHDLNYENSDGSAAERLQFQWGEYNLLSLNPSLTGGNFTLRYGNKVTAPITPVLDSLNLLDTTATRAAIQSRLEETFGVGNVRVSFLNAPLTNKPDYAINFIGSLARTDITPEGLVATDNLIVPSGPGVTLTPAINPNPSDENVARAALNHVIDNGTFDNGSGPSPVLKYTNDPSGLLAEVDPLNPAKRTVRKVGGFSSSTAELNTQVAIRYLGVVDSLFVGALPGIVNLTGSITQLPTGPGTGGDNLGIAVFGARAVYLTANEVVLPSGTITIRDELTAVNDSFLNQVSEGIPATLDVGSNDTDKENRPFGIISVTQPTNNAGSVSFAPGGAAKTVLFTPNGDYFGPTTFTYTIRNSANFTSTATVTVEVLPVNDPPVVLNRNFSVSEDPTSPLVINRSNVFSPGPDNESAQTVTMTMVTPPPSSQGSATINADGNLEFDPADDFFGTVNVVVRGTDSGPNTSPNSNNTVATLTITVNPINDAPIPVSTPLAFTLTEGIARSIPVTDIFRAGPQNEINAPQNQTVSLAVIAPLPSATQLVPSIVSGQLVLTPQGDFFTLPNTPVLVVVRGTDTGPNTPSPNANTTDATLTITINNVNDPPIAVNDPGLTVIALNAANILNVLANDSPGPNNEPGTIIVHSVQNLSPANAGSISVAAGGVGVSFTPSTAPSFFGTDATFSYTIKDQDGLTATANATVKILPPASPFAVDDDYRANAALIINEDTSATFDVLANDYSTGTKSLTSGGNPSQPVVIRGPGSVSIEGNRIRYTPVQDGFGEVVFTYSMDDTDTTVEPNERRLATATILVQPINDAPIPVSNSLAFTLTEGVARTISVSDIFRAGPQNEIDAPQSQTVSLSILPPLPSSSQLVASIAGGQLVLTPQGDFFTAPNTPILVVVRGTDSGPNSPAPNANSTDATLTITITNENDPPNVGADPVANWNPTVNPDDRFTLPENTPFAASNKTIAIATLLLNDDPGTGESAAPANQSISFVGLAGAAGPTAGTFLTSKGGTVTVSGTNILYTPKLSYNKTEGLDTFTYEIKDNLELKSVGTVTMNVTEVNDPPESKPQPVATVSVFPGTDQIDLSQILSATNWSRGAPNEASQSLILFTFTDPTIGGVQVGQFSITGSAKDKFQYTIPFDPTITESRFTTLEFVVQDNGAGLLTGTGKLQIEIKPYEESSIRGIVFVDSDADGVLDRSGSQLIETPIGGVEVTLTYTNTSGVQVTKTEMTAADGSYDFMGLIPSTYTITFSTPQHMVLGQGVSTTENLVISGRGGVNEEFHFPVQGVSSQYFTYLDLLYPTYNPQNPSQRRGLQAAIGADGETDWTLQLANNPTGVFYEVVLSENLQQAFLTEISLDGKRVRTTTVDRRDFYWIRTADGGYLVRIIKNVSEFSNWTIVNIPADQRSINPWLSANPSNPARNTRGYLETVDDFFRQGEWAK